VAAVTANPDTERISVEGLKFNVVLEETATPEPEPLVGVNTN
jgi:hypothetical protein